MKSRALISVLAVTVAMLFLSPSLQAQTTIHVDDDAPNDPGPGDPLVSDPAENGSVSHPFDAIQEAIYAAVDGDTVQVADGLYDGVGNRNMSFLGKAITVRSENGPADCTVDCGETETENRWGFEFISGEGPAAILEGFTITRPIINYSSPTTHGSGVFTRDSSPTIIGNTITQCLGHAVDVEGESPTFIDNVITDNQSTGIWCIFTDATFTGNTISNCDHRGMYVSSGSSPLISDNVIVGNGHIQANGGGIYVYCQDTAPRIVGNLIAENVGNMGGGLYVWHSYSGDYFATPVIDDNIITGNYAWRNGGGVCSHNAVPLSFTNNLIADNHAREKGGGFYGWGLLDESRVATIRNCTISGNSTSSGFSGAGGGIALQVYEPYHNCVVDFYDCIISDNISERGANIYFGWTEQGMYSYVYGTFDHCLLKDADQTVLFGNQYLILATPLILDDPLFMTGTEGDYYLSQSTAGQPADSPALDVGSDLATSICFDGGGATVCLDERTTRTDGVTDTGAVDLGYHYSLNWETVLASLNCTPSSGTLPFSSQFSVSMTNQYQDQARRLRYWIDVTLPGGQVYGEWRKGWQNVQAGELYQRTWWQSIPGWGTLVGDIDFLLTVADVTPAPYNQPPYPAAGDTDTAVCTVTGIAP